MRTRLYFLCFVVSTVFAHLCMANILVEYYTAGGALLFDEGPYLNGSNVSVAINDSQVGIVRVFSDDGGDIGRVTVTGTKNQSVWVFVAWTMTLGDAFYTLESAAAGNNWAGIRDNRASGTEIVKAYVLGNLTNTVEADNLQSLQVKGAIQSAVIADGGSCRIQAGSTGAGGDISQTTGEVNTVQILTGDLLGDVIAATTIGTITVNGNIGNSNQTTTIQATGGKITTIEASGNIGDSGDSNKVLIKANPATDTTGIDTVRGTNIYAKITANVTPGKGQFKRLEATGAAGKFMGRLTCTSLESLVDIPGNFDGQIECSAALDADVKIGGDFVGAGAGRSIKATQLTSGHTLSIGGKFTDGAGGQPAEINFSDAGGLDGQIIINANNGVYIPWTTPWTGDVIVHGTTVTPGAYTNTDLGDGATGLVRFDLQKLACIPYDGQSVNANAIPNNRADLVHYGPVRRSSNSYLCVVVQRSTNSGITWTDVSSQFEPDTGGTGGRVISIKPKAGYSWQAASEYRITHNGPGGSGGPYPYIRCVDVTSEPSALQYVYHFYTN